MGKRVWVRVLPWDKGKVTAALEAGADGVIVPEGYYDKVKELGLIDVIAPDGDVKMGEDVVEIEINSKEDEERAAQEGKNKIVIVKTGDWRVIPLENLVAQSESVFACVGSLEEAKLVMQVLEKGVAGVVVEGDASKIKEIVAALKKMQGTLGLSVGKITKISSLGMGDRVCIDTCTNMRIGQGMLVGNTSDGFFLVHSESVETPYVAPRPFRVNAGGVHAYILLPDGKTKYLSELQTGDEVLIVNHDGTCEVGIVGRCKVERRPMMLVEAECQGRKLSLIMQNAETIRLTSPSGEPLSIVKLKSGDEVLVYLEEAGRHFGMKVKESIVEK